MQSRHFPVKIHSNVCYVAILMNNPGLQVRRRQKHPQMNTSNYLGYVDTLLSCVCKENYASQVQLANGIDRYETTQWEDNIDMA